MPADTILHDGEFLRLKRRDNWEYVERANARAAVIIVAVTDDDALLLVEQPRVPIGGPVLELPAGLVGDIAGAEDEAGVRGGELEDELPEEAVGPGEPGAGEVGHVVSRKGLVHEAGGRGGGLELGEAARDLRLVVRGQGLDDESERPDAPWPRVRAPDPVERAVSALEEEWVRP